MMSYVCMSNCFRVKSGLRFLNVTSKERKKRLLELRSAMLSVLTQYQTQQT